MTDYLPVIRTAVDAAMVTLIVLVQLVIYPAFYTIEDFRFIQWHQRYIKTIACVVVPLMLVQAGCITKQLLEISDWSTVVSAAAVLAAWTTTFTLSAPCHRKLQTVGRDPVLIAWLIHTNWIRTISWGFAFLAGLVKY